MTLPKSKLRCVKCNGAGRGCTFYKGKLLCKKCQRRLPSTRLQDRVITYYELIEGKRPYPGRPKKVKK